MAIIQNECFEMLDEIFFLYILVICTRLNGAKKSKCAHTTQNARKTQLYRSNRTQTPPLAHQPEK